MGQFVGFIAGGLVAAAALTYLSAPNATDAAARDAVGSIPSVQLSVQRRNKGDRLPSAIVSKNVTLPEVTTREKAPSPVEPARIEATKPKAAQPRPPGCEPAFSPLTSPGLAHVIRGCVA